MTSLIVLCLILSVLAGCAALSLRAVWPLSRGGRAMVACGVLAFAIPVAGEAWAQFRGHRLPKGEASLTRVASAGVGPFERLQIVAVDTVGAAVGSPVSWREQILDFEPSEGVSEIEFSLGLGSSASIEAEFGAERIVWQALKGHQVGFLSLHKSMRAIRDPARFAPDSGAPLKLMSDDGLTSQSWMPTVLDGGQRRTLILARALRADDRLERVAAESWKAGFARCLAVDGPMFFVSPSAAGSGSGAGLLFSGTHAGGIALMILGSFLILAGQVSWVRGIALGALSIVTIAAIAGRADLLLRSRDLHSEDRSVRETAVVRLAAMPRMADSAAEQLESHFRREVDPRLRRDLLLRAARSPQRTWTRLAHLLTEAQRDPVVAVAATARAIAEDDEIRRNPQRRGTRPPVRVSSEGLDSAESH